MQGVPLTWHGIRGFQLGKWMLCLTAVLCMRRTSCTSRLGWSAGTSFARTAPSRTARVPCLTLCAYSNSGLGKSNIVCAVVKRLCASAADW